MTDIFDLKEVSPMMLMGQSTPFDSPDYVYELKLGGIRALAYLDGGGTEIRSRRNKRLNDIYPELSQLHTQVGRRCILDGEIVVMAGYKPDFPALQRRSLMSGTMRISMAARRKPVQFVAFDILYDGNRQITGMKLLERKEILASAVREGESLAVSRHIYEKGTDFYNRAVSQGLEGVVAKRAGSFYHMGRHTRDWVNFQKKQEADEVVCGFTPDGEGGIRSLHLGICRHGRLIDQGTVAFGAPGAVRDTILRFARKHSAPCPLEPPIRNEGTIWIAPEIVCTVEYTMRTEGGYMRQPVFKGLALDKSVEECVADW